MFSSRETDSLTTVRDFIRTLLGPRPHLNPILGSGESGAMHDIERQKSELIAYRAKVGALIKMLEGGLKVAGGNGPVAGPAGRRVSGLSKPMAAGAARKRRAA